MVKRDVVNGEKVYKNIRRKIHIAFLIILIVCFGAIFAAAYIDLNVSCKEKLYSCVAETLSRHNSSWYEAVLSMKHAVADNIEEFYDTLIAITSILAATVIFFYSVQDNKREGIPHRAILAYSFGSYTIPVFFFSSMLILPMSFWFFHFNMRVTFIVCMVGAYIFQIAIIALILFSTSYTCGLRVICNAEIRQYKKLCKIGNEGNRNLEGNPQFIWTYLMHHLEQAVTSDELIADKMILVRSILKTPFYEKKVPLCLWEKREDKYVDGMSKNCLEKNNLGRIYEFYYGNLSAVMEYLNKRENDSERNKIYLVLYEFLENLQRLYQKVENVQQADGSSKAMRNYMMTISGMMNAVLDSGTPDAEGFCNYVFNECIKDREIRQKQIGLYFLFQDYLYRTYIEGEDDERIIPVQ